MIEGQLIVTETTDGLDILGIVGLDPALRPLIGTGETKVATVLNDSHDGNALEQVVTRHIIGGEQVINGYVKFAKPIKLTGTKAGMDAIRELLKNSKPKQQEKQAAYAPFTIESPLHDLLNAIAVGDMEKVATHPFNEALFSAIDAEKWDAGELGFPTSDAGFPVNCKIKFANKEAEELFSNAFKLMKHKKAAAQEEAAQALIKAGAVSSPIADVAKAVEADPARAPLTLAAHCAIAIKRGDTEKVAALRPLMGNSRT